MYEREKFAKCIFSLLNFFIWHVLCYFVCIKPSRRM